MHLCGSALILTQNCTQTGMIEQKSPYFHTNDMDSFTIKRNQEFSMKFMKGVKHNVNPPKKVD